MSVQLDITNACNLACTHCYHPHHSNKGFISIAQWSDILDQIEAFLRKYSFNPYFMICGGEPLISPILKPIIEKIKRIWPDSSILILSNGTIQKSEILDYLSGFNVEFQISLDGPDASRHDQVRGIGNFEKSCEGIRLFKSKGFRVSILSILSQRSFPWISDYFDLAKSLKVDSQNFTRLIAQGAGKNLVDSKGDSSLVPEDLKKAFESIIIHSYRSGVPTNTDQPLFALIDNAFGQSGLYGFDGLVIDYKGNLKATSRANIVLGSVLKDGLENLYINHDIFRKVRNKDIEVCGRCSLFNQCGGDRNAAYAEFGDFAARDPGCWKFDKTIGV
ncbi:radical SAM protein [Oligoflexus tunisiensis]|uniref:radical SAM protein n=1 Tax=Oligoflexus tunisiensis TaxID=708132 RepID=UPI001FE17BC1|nr:radical SAM protein [Oligoflexus tunisiensis]